ncbi:MAG: flagellar hook-length control protein FliK [Gammaproteobacteria bacterium]|nr:flagellar hook-length control protein FliK [Gammaproteobacteria bacterium]NNF60027.1 flagellar hook-length control protein FliK [Gammaproteobacteria bacterium]NNM19958.1 flagellar hook-length control protein FliK [Gammaproteobacteria bacterium]
MPTSRIPADALRAPAAATTRATGPAAAAVLRTPAVSNAWQLGTLLDAIALSDSVDGRVRLQIGARVVDAQTSLPLRSGQTLRLEVAETGRTVVLRNVAEQNTAETIKAGMRQSLPRQLPQTRVLEAAMQLAKPDVRLPPQLNAVVTKLIETVQTAATLTRPEGLRAAVRESGTFLESRLAAAAGEPVSRAHVAGNDWKAGLLRFRDQLAQLQQRLAAGGNTRPAAANTLPRVTSAAHPAPAVVVTHSAPVQQSTAAVMLVVQTRAPLPAVPVTVQSLVTVQSPAANLQHAAPPMRHALPQPQPVNQQPAAMPGEPLLLLGDLINKSDGALARVRLNQLASITPDTSPRHVWLLELPVQHPDGRAEIVPLRIERDDESGGLQQQAAWTVDLAFDLGRRGALRARVALRAGKVSASFWADADDTRAEVSGRLGQLEDALKKKELDVGSLTCGGSQPIDPAPPESGLLEAKA